MDAGSKKPTMARKLSAEFFSSYSAAADKRLSPPPSKGD
jgi:hypothetical protein